MDQINQLRSIDLNLLVVLKALLSERHVTRAGKALGLSQSATSNALERLRQLFGDPLLERTAKGMVPTPLAQRLEAELDLVLASVSKIVAPRADLSSLTQTIRWTIVDYGIALFAPALMASLQTTAPNLNLITMPWTGADDTFDDLADGTVDLVVSVIAQGAAALRWEPLATERYVVAMRSRHPARRGFSLDKWLQYPHVVVSGRGQVAGSLDAVLASRGKARRVAMVVPSFLAVPRIVAESDLLALVPERLLAAGEFPGVTSCAPPVPVPSFEVGVAWHARRDHDAATMHVVRTLAKIARKQRRTRAT